MQNQNFGEFDNFDDFFNDILRDLDDAPSVTPAPVKDTSAPEPSGAVPSYPVTPETDYVPVERRSSHREEVSARDSGQAGRRDKAEPVKSSPRSMKGSGFFLAALFTITVLAWALPLRPTSSVSEKRELETFPVFSISDLANGEYFKGIDSWFADTFTFRDKWMKASETFKKGYGINTVAIFGDIPVNDAVPIPSPVVHEDSNTADITPVISESIPTEEEPAEQAAGVLPEELAEAPEQSDSLPEEEDYYVEEDDVWGGVTVSEDELIADKGGKLMIGDSVFLYPGFNQYNAERYAEIMNKAADLLEGKANYYCIIVPENVSSMLTREDREKYNFIIEEDALEYTYSLMDSNVNKVNVLKNLQKHNDEYIVFRTDHHWTAVGAYYAYEEWCKYAGKTPVPLSEYEEVVWEDFYGTYYYASGEPKNLRDNPDDVHAFYPPGDVHLYLDFNNKDVLGEEYDVLLDRSVRKVDQYVTFLTSDQAKATFINNSIDDDSACVVMKDSFGNPFSYYLTQHYHYVYVLDMRYYGYRGIVSFVDEFNVSDVIMIHSSGMCYSEGPLSVVRSLIK